MPHDLSWLMELTEDDLPLVGEIVPELVLARLKQALAAAVKARTPVGTMFVVTSSGRSFGGVLVEKGK